MCRKAESAESAELKADEGGESVIVAISICCTAFSSEGEKSNILT